MMLARANSYPAGVSSGKRQSRTSAAACWPALCPRSSAPVRQATGVAALAASSSARAPQAFSTGRANRRTAVKVNANWGAPVEFTSTKVVANTSAASGPLHKLVVDLGPLKAGYTIPGQFVQIKVGDSKPGFFAIASAPGALEGGLVEFLIKGAPGSTAELLCNAAAGSDVSVSPVMGKGFALDRLPASTTGAVLMFATGSGISPIKAILDSGALKGRDVTLYYGTRNTDSTAYRELVPTWQASGVKVVQVFSESKQGYVHDVFEREGLARLPADAASSVGAVMCGHKGMCQAVTALLTAKGVPPEKILLNF